MYDAENAQITFSKYITHIIYEFNECCPMERANIKYNNRHAWITIDLKNYIKKGEYSLTIGIRQPTVIT